MANLPIGCRNDFVAPPHCPTHLRTRPVRLRRCPDDPSSARRRPLDCLRPGPDGPDRPRDRPADRRHRRVRAAPVGAPAAATRTRHCPERAAARSDDRAEPLGAADHADRVGPGRHVRRGPGPAGRRQRHLHRRPAGSGPARRADDRHPQSFRGAHLGGPLRGRSHRAAHRMAPGRGCGSGNARFRAADRTALRHHPPIDGRGLWQTGRGR
jgi:hypothetical protein